MVDDLNDDGIWTSLAMLLAVGFKNPCVGEPHVNSKATKKVCEGLIMFG